MASKIKKAITKDNVLYGLPGTSITIRCEAYLVPEGYIEISEESTPTRFHILDDAGDWTLPENVDYKELRKEEYLKQCPITEQLEAVLDASNGDDTKLNLIKSRIQEIKNRYPSNK